MVGPRLDGEAQVPVSKEMRVFPRAWLRAAVALSPPALWVPREGAVAPLLTTAAVSPPEIVEPSQPRADALSPGHELVRACARKLVERGWQELRRC